MALVILTRLYIIIRLFLIYIIIHCTHTVNNFQTITEELARKQENMDQNDELAKLREDLHNELTMHEAKMTNARYRMQPIVAINIMYFAESQYLFRHLLVIQLLVIQLAAVQLEGQLPYSLCQL